MKTIRPGREHAQKANDTAPDAAGKARGDLAHRFQPGHTKGLHGRPAGIPNKVTIEAREAAAEIIDNPAYRAKLLDRALKGKLPPPVENLLWHYAKGVPKQILDVNQRTIDATKMPTEDLKAELVDLLSRL